MKKPKFGINPFKPVRFKPMKVHFNLDTDRDKLIDWKDCRPFDKKRHGVDVYLCWEGQRNITKEITQAFKEGHNINSPKVKKLLNSFPRTGKEGYLRGAYFGGYSDLLEYLFGFWNWENQPIPFGIPEQNEFEKRLDEISIVRGRKESKYGKAFKHLPDFLISTGFSEVHTNDPNKPVEDWWLKECRDFLNLAKVKTRKGVKVWVEISY